MSVQTSRGHLAGDRSLRVDSVPAATKRDTAVHMAGMETTTPARVPAGVQAGGQFAAVTHHEPGLSLVPAPVDGPDFDYDFEKAHGARLRKALEELPAVTARAAVNASRVSDLMRDSYSVYWADGTALQARPRP